MRWACGACVVHHSVSLPSTLSKLRDRAARLHRRRVHARIEHVLAHDDVRVLEDAVGGLAVAGLPVEDVVVRAALDLVADDRGALVERRLGVDDRRQRLVLDVDELERVARRVAVVGDDEGDLLVLEADLVGGQHVLHVGRQRRDPGQVEALEVLAGEHGVDLRVLQGGRRVDRDDPRVGERAAQHGAVQHARQLDVVDEVAVAADQPRVLLALEPAVADRALLDGGHQPVTSSRVSAIRSAPSGWCSAAQRIERMMVE